MNARKQFLLSVHYYQLFMRLTALFLSMVPGIFYPEMAFSQYFSTGQDPGSLKWRVIKTTTIKLIYPVGFERNAQYLANILDLLAQPETKTLKAKVPRMPVIIHELSSESNGITSWAPKRIELFPCPPQSIYSEEWQEQLAVHEYRHAVQLSKMNRGFTKFLYFIFGEQATGGVLGLYIPRWFLEGDAVTTETALTSTGRGRLPSFEAILRAQLLEKKIYTYNKATLGSYKTFIPDIYSLGYYLVAKGREEFGSSLWDNTLDNVAKYPFLVPFAHGIKKNSSLSKVKFYRKMLQELDTAWRKQTAMVEPASYKLLTHPDQRDYTIYDHPLYAGDSTIIAVKESFNDITRFVMIRENGKVKKLLTPGNYQDGSLTISKGILAWAELQPDVRWSNRSYSIIRTYDLKSRKRKNLTHRTRYFAPALSQDGKFIAAVDIGTTNIPAIIILDACSGKKIKRIPCGSGETIITPHWSDDGTSLVYIILDEKGKKIVHYNLYSGIERTLLPSTYDELPGHLALFDHRLVYSADYSGINNIYALDTASGSISRVTSAPFRAFDPDISPNRKKMIFSDYCSDGLMIAETAVQSISRESEETPKNTFYPLYASSVRQENFNLQDTTLNRKLFRMLKKDSTDPGKEKINGKIYPSKKYSKFLHLFRFQSWAPASFDLNNFTLHPGFMLLSQNMLSTAFTNIGYDYDLNEQTGKFYAGFSYQGWFPVLDFFYSYGNRAGNILYTNGRIQRFTWNESNLSAALSIPFNFSHGMWYMYMTPSLGTNLIDVIHNQSTPEFYTSGWISLMNYSLSFSNYIHSNFKDINPKWGQTLTVTFRNSLFPENDLGSIFAVYGTFNFPGILNHHGINIYLGYQDKEEKYLRGYKYSDLVPYPLGIAGQDDSQLYSASLNYAFPFLNIDLSAGSVLYIKRFRTNLFFDYSEGWTNNIRRFYRSAGIDLLTELHILRFLYPFELGLRTIYLPDNNSLQFQFLYGIKI